MTLYEAHVARAYRGFPTPPPSELTAQSIASLLRGSSVRPIAAFEDGYVVAIEMHRGDHPIAMTEITRALDGLGYAVFDAVITEFVNSLLEGAAFGAASGAVLGAATKSGAGFLILFVGGFAAGAWFGSSQRRVKARYVSRRTFQGGRNWQITRLEPDPPGAQPQPM